jgi:hypothetical protein
VLLVLFGDAAVRGAAKPLNKEEQTRVNEAIDAGVAYLRRAQGPRGTWAGPKETHVIGYAALPGLTLLECGVAPDEQVIRRVAVAVRRAVPSMDATYEIALSILFLDRLGDPQDRELIQTLAVRLIAGQTATGGWSYKCPLVGKKVHQEIVTALKQRDALEPVARVPGAPLAGAPAERKPGGAPPEGTSTANKPSTKETTTRRSPPSPAGGPPELPNPPGRKPAAEAPKPAAENAGKPAADAPELSARLKALPVFMDPDALFQRQERRTKASPRLTSIADNSNTQFATLALWVAQRYDVPARRTLQLITRRFETSQNTDGSWSYLYTFSGNEGGRPSMTCVGLLGLAVGHGIAQPARAPAGAKPPADPRVVKGLVALSQSVGEPNGNWRYQPMENLYFLWSVERVGVLYGLTTIGDKDWYRWGAEILVANQDKRGHWANGGYHGASPTIDTCLALLFLKRANLVSDLTSRLPFKPDELKQSVTETAPSSKPPSLEKKP